VAWLQAKVPLHSFVNAGQEVAPGGIVGRCAWQAGPFFHAIQDALASVALGRCWMVYSWNILARQRLFSLPASSVTSFSLESVHSPHLGSRDLPQVPGIVSGFRQPEHRKESYR
jgi:hypothetical protein